MCDKELKDNSKKIKFHDTGLSRDLEIERMIYVPGMLPSRSNHQTSNIDVETYLLHPEYNFDKKSKVVLDIDEENKDKDYRNFSLEGNELRKNLYYGDYINNGFKGQGRGNGDYEIGSNLRYGIPSRLEDNNVRQSDISKINFNSADLGIGEPSNTVLPFARGGIDTRNLDKYRKENN